MRHLKRHVPRVLLLLLLSGGVFTAQAQTLRGGVNLARFLGIEDEPQEDVMGLNAGLSFRLAKIGPVSLTPELYYAQKGSKLLDRLADPDSIGIDPEDPDIPSDLYEETYDLTYSLAYIEVPVILRVDLPLENVRPFRPYVSGGPVLAWRLDCNFSLTTPADQTVQACTDGKFDSFNTALKSADWGLVLGAGVDVAVPYLGGLNLDARYTRGLARLRSDGENNDIQNRSLTLMLGYAFGL